MTDVLLCQVCSEENADSSDAGSSDEHLERGRPVRALELAIGIPSLWEEGESPMWELWIESPYDPLP